MSDEPEDTGRFEALLARARELAESVFAPNAAATDQADGPPEANIRRLAGAGLMGLTTPIPYGGHGAPAWLLRAYTEILARACGVTTFVQGQHQSAAAMIAGGENQALKEEMLPRLASGEFRSAVAFSHLRRPGPPAMRVTRDGEAYVFNGTAPWVTGWGVMTHVVLGGTLEDGRLLYVAIPLDIGEPLQPSPPMRLCAMNASGTVSLTCRDLRVGPERVMRTITREQMARNDVRAILGVTPQPFGVTSASIGWLRALLRTRANPAAEAAAGALERELSRLRCEAEAWYDRADEPDFKENALRIRAAAIDLGVRAAHAALAASGGGANALSHPAQRLFREAMFYTLVAQTPDVQTTTLYRIAEAM